MTEIEALVREELERRVPLRAVPVAWEDVLERAGEPSRRPRLLLVAAIAAVFVAVTATALAGPIGRGLGDFSEWLSGEPGTPASREEQGRFERSDRGSNAPFPDRPRLRRLVQLDVGGAQYTLLGFRSGVDVCLRLVVEGIRRTGPEMACVVTDELRRTGVLAMPLRANVGLGISEDEPSGALATFGLTGGRVRAITLVSDDGPVRATVANGAFLGVLTPSTRETRVRRAFAVDHVGRRHPVPIVINEKPPPRAYSIPGPKRVERRVAGGTIAWLDRRATRGLPFNSGFRSRQTRLEFARVVQPDPRDFLRVVVGAGRDPRTGGPELCYGELIRTGSSLGCEALKRVFARQPFVLSAAFSGAGSQFRRLIGIASDEVARIRLFLVTGEVRALPLRDNAVAGRVWAAELPGRVVAYDRARRVIGVQMLPGAWVEPPPRRRHAR